MMYNLEFSPTYHTKNAQQVFYIHHKTLVKRTKKNTHNCNSKTKGKSIQFFYLYKKANKKQNKEKMKTKQRKQNK